MSRLEKFPQFPQFSNRENESLFLILVLVFFKQSTMARHDRDCIRFFFSYKSPFTFINIKLRVGFNSNRPTQRGCHMLNLNKMNIKAEPSKAIFSKVAS